MNAAQNPVEVLQLKDIHLPPPPGLWPPAPGWWLLAALLLVVTLWLGWKFWQWRRDREAQRQRQTALQQIRRLFEQGDTQQAIIETNLLLRKAALAHFPESEVAPLTGQRWLDFLDRSGDTKAFTEGPGRVLAQGPYQSRLDQTIDERALLQAVEKWLDSVARDNGRYGRRRR